MIPRNDIATYSLITGGEYDPATGRIKPIQTELIEVNGRYEANNGSFTVRGNDGVFTQARFVFYMDLDCPIIPLETELSVMDESSGITFTGVVKMYNKGILNAYVLCQ